MKSSIFAALVGIATAGGSLRVDEVPTATKTTYSNVGIAPGSLGTVLPVYEVSSGAGKGAQLTGVSDLAVSSNGRLAGGSAAGSANGLLTNVGSGAVLVTGTSTGASNIISGQVITDGNYPKADLSVFNPITSGYVNSNVLASNVINNANSNTATSTKSIDSLFTKLPSSAELDALVLSADSVAILKTVQTIGTN